jgi:hypothetical protein
MDRRGTVITAVVLIAIGAYVLLANLNVIPLPHYANVARHCGAGGHPVLAGLHLRQRS